MPINRVDKIVFIHIPKTGGTSVETMLNLNELKSLKKVCPSPQHMTGLSLRKRIGTQLWKRCFRFTIVRNPYTRILSEFNWGGSAIQTDNFMEFLNRVQTIVQKNKCYSKFKYDHFLPQYKYLENVRIHYVGKFEDFEGVIRHIEKRTGKKVARVHAQKGTRTTKKLELTQQEKDIIYSIYKKDFEMFGYER